MGVVQNRIVGIDDMSAYIPQLYLPIASLAEARDIEYAKLNKGLGLTNMALADVHEDAATMAANAVLQLIEQNDLHPAQIGRIYLGSESSVDGAKPMATYVLEMLGQYFSDSYGPDCFLNCDVVDLTFACIGSIDAMHNTLDWVRAGQDRIGIIVGSDVAKYELNSTGEYTQGAGAVALLIKENPRLMSIGEHWGIATRGVHDFFKPVRKLDKKALIKEVIKITGKNGIDIDALLEQLENKPEVTGILDDNNRSLTLHKDTPVFDGPYSNNCYQERIKEALAHYAQEAGLTSQTPVTDDWRRLVFHLPYAFQARRMFSEIFYLESVSRGDWPALKVTLELEVPQAADFNDEAAYQKAYGKFLRAVSKTDRYRTFVNEKIAKGEWASSHMGNLYTSSLFLALMSTLEQDLEEETALGHQQFGFFGYGSGSKSKVFTGTVQPGWEKVVARFQLKKRLDLRKAVSYADYEALHRGRLLAPLGDSKGIFYLSMVNEEKGTVLEGARSYRWSADTEVKVS
jgi:hydroxymethylglutaryl-CoA synthase